MSQVSTCLFFQVHRGVEVENYISHAALREHAHSCVKPANQRETWAAGRGMGDIRGEGLRELVLECFPHPRRATPRTRLSAGSLVARTSVMDEQATTLSPESSLSGD